MSNDNQITLNDNFGPVAEAFKNSPIDNSAWTAGIGMAWPILTLRGKTWGWRFRGESRIFEAPNANAGGSIMPVQHLDVVLVQPSQRISKVYYKDGYDPQNPTRKPPDCWSVDGIMPDPTVSERQNPTCGGCRWNVFGSNIGPAGQKGKACSDNKRLAVVTLNDLPNVDFGGPFMLRLPPGSFANYTNYVSVMAARGYQPYTVVTRLLFDPTVAHPKVMFFPQRPLQARGSGVHTCAPGQPAHRPDAERQIGGGLRRPGSRWRGGHRPFAFFDRTERQLGWYQWMVRNGYSGR